jgi:fucose 4-O-acetylase-like acetyltransferase
MARQNVRDPVIDAMRGLAILLVIFGHALEIFIFKRLAGDFSLAAEDLYRAIYSFHMPLFYFVSGMVSLTLPKKSLRTVLAASGALIFMALLSHAAFLPAQIITHARLKTMMLPFFSWSDFNIITTWFLVSIAFVRIFAWLYLRGGIWRRLTILIFLTASWVVSCRLGIRIFQIHTLAPGLLFFLLGNSVVRKMSVMKTLKKSSLIIISVAAFAVVAMTYSLNKGGLVPVLGDNSHEANRHAFCVFFLSGWYGNPFYLFLTASAGILGVLSLALAESNRMLERLLAKVGEETLSLLLLNGVFLVGVQPALRAFFPVFPFFTIVAICGVLTALQISILPLIAIPTNNFRRFLAEKMLSI